MSTARHTYGDWIRHLPSGKVAVITSSAKIGFCNWICNVEYQDGRIEALTTYDYDFITEREYYMKVDPSRCEEPIRTLVDSYRVSPNMQEDFFCGGKMKSYFLARKEDYFA